MQGLTFTTAYGIRPLSRAVDLIGANGVHVRLAHTQVGDEFVRVFSVTGNTDHLLNSPILEVTQNLEPYFGQPTRPEYTSGTFTVFNFATEKGRVEIVWLGESNNASENVEIITVN